MRIEEIHPVIKDVEGANSNSWDDDQPAEQEQEVRNGIEDDNSSRIA